MRQTSGSGQKHKVTSTASLQVLQTEGKLYTTLRPVQQNKGKFEKKKKKKKGSDSFLLIKMKIQIKR